MSSGEDSNTLLEIVSSVGGLKIEIWSEDFEHAVSGHPEVTLKKVKDALKDPSRVVQSKSSANTCLFYSVEIKVTESESLYFCVVVGVKTSGAGKLITAYDTDYIKTGKTLFLKGDKK